MISKEEAIKLINTKFDYCNIEKIIERENSYIFCLVYKIGGQPMIGSPIIVNKEDGTWEHLPSDPPIPTVEVEIPQWMFKKS